MTIFNAIINTNIFIKMELQIVFHYIDFYKTNEYIILY